MSDGSLRSVESLLRFSHPLFTFFFRFAFHLLHDVCMFGSPMSERHLEPGIKIFALNVCIADFAFDCFHCDSLRKVKQAIYHMTCQGTCSHLRL